MNNLQTAPKITKESKNKIRVEFERTPLLERLKSKFISVTFVQKVAIYIFKFMFLLGISYVILFPFFSKISSSFMSPSDIVDVTVSMIPRYPTLDIYKAIITENNYFEAFGNTLLLSLACAVLQTFTCCLIAYGFAKFKFKLNGLLFLIVIVTMVIPHATLRLSMYQKFKYFDFLGIFEILGNMNIIEKPYLSMTNSYWPLVLLSITGLGFKNGLYIFMLRQYFKGVPDELEESAYLDGCGVFKTFFQIILPLSVPMLITVFMFSFSWQWTDNFYTETFFSFSGPTLMPDMIQIPRSLDIDFAGKDLYKAAVRNTSGIMILLPLVLLYSFMQRYIIQGIERSGITG